MDYPMQSAMSPVTDEDAITAAQFDIDDAALFKFVRPYGSNDSMCESIENYSTKLHKKMD